MLEKVCIFVTRGPAEARELLVFRHPSGGVQLPAGTVEENEPHETAAFRETREETGLTAVALVALLETTTATMRPDDRLILRRVALRQHPAPDAPVVPTPFPTFLGLRRGLYVRLIGESEAGFAPVIYEEYDGPAHEATAPSRFVTGWVEDDAISATVVRHFYHLTPTEPTLETWVQSAEEWEHRFELYWVPLSASVPGLVPSQAVWLDQYRERLMG